MEKVGFTATEQWDQLLNVATGATRLLGSDEASVASSEVRDEHTFIDDDEG